MDDQLRELERTWQEHGTVVAGQAYLAGLKRAGSPTDDLRRRLLELQLVGAGIDASTFAPFELLEGGPVCRLTVPGAASVDAWRAIRALHPVTGYWPVLIGEEVAELSFLEESQAHHDSLEAMLDEIAAAGTEAGLERERARRRTQIEALRAHDASPDFLSCLEEELAKVGQPLPRLTDADPELIGEWPVEATPSTTFTTPYDIMTQVPHPRVGLLLIPTSAPETVPAWLRFGRWNACPHPAQHGARFRDWRERFGAEVVAITHDVVEMTVSRPPTTREAALELAWEQFHYCDDIVHQGTYTLSALAAGLLNGTTWYFWWD